MNWIVEACKREESELIYLRRELHKIPEIGNCLPKTAAFVMQTLEKWNIPYKSNTGDDGVVVEIASEKDGKTVAFRADMDGLHNDEKTNLPFSSEIVGQMHGCGHDAHTAVLLIVAKILSENKDKFSGKARLLFQTGEETGTGAKQMIAEGAMENVDEVYALHVGNLASDDLQTGDLAILSGPVSAGKNKFTITVNGVGTHSAFPEKGVDPILIAARIVNGCEELTARELYAGCGAVISFGSLNAGIDHNTIPEKAVIKGSIRCQDPNLREFLSERLISLSENIAKAYRATATVDLVRGSSTIENDPQLAKKAYAAAKKALGNEHLVGKIDRALMGSDDFANYIKTKPGVYFILHTNNK